MGPNANGAIRAVAPGSDLAPPAARRPVSRDRRRSVDTPAPLTDRQQRIHELLVKLRPAQGVWVTADAMARKLSKSGQTITTAQVSRDLGVLRARGLAETLRRRREDDSRQSFNGWRAT